MIILQFKFTKIMKEIQGKILKTIIFLTIVAFCSFSVSAQKIDGGFLAGLSTSQIDGDTQKDFDKLGLFSGVFVETGFAEVFGVKIELYYIAKGAKKNIDGVEEFKTHLNYIEMPFFVKIGPLKKIELDLGIAVSYLISMKMLKYGEEVETSTLNMHNFDFNGIVSANYFFLPNMAFNFRVSYSIIPVKNNHNWFNSNLSFGLAYRIK